MLICSPFPNIGFLLLKKKNEEAEVDVHASRKYIHLSIFHLCSIIIVYSELFHLIVVELIHLIELH